MRIRAWLPLLCALLAVEGAAREACAPFWLQPAYLRFECLARELFFDSAVHAANRTIRTATQPNRMILAADRATFHQAIKAPEQVRSIPQRLIALLNQAIHSLLMRPSVHGAMVAEQPRPSTPAAARRTARTPSLPCVTKQKEPV